MSALGQKSPLEDLPLFQCLGNTPVLEIPYAQGKILVKVEKGNPGGSIKDRAAWGMLRFLMLSGKLRENSIIVEPTSGNTGIALGWWGKCLNLPVRLTMPENMSLERRKLLACYGADLVLTPEKRGMSGAIEEAWNMAAEDSRVLIPDQFSNPGNPWAHEKTTAPELIETLRGREAPSAFVAGVGTGGTLTGVARGLRKRYPHLIVGAVEPEESAVLSGNSAGIHGIQGIGAGFIPANCDTSIIDRIIAINTEEALEKSLWLTRKHGLFCGFSTGANLAGAVKLLDSGITGTVITVAPDGGERYLGSYPEK